MKSKWKGMIIYGLLSGLTFALLMLTVDSSEGETFHLGKFAWRAFSFGVTMVFVARITGPAIDKKKTNANQ